MKLWTSRTGSKRGLPGSPQTSPKGSGAGSVLVRFGYDDGETEDGPKDGGAGWRRKEGPHDRFVVQTDVTNGRVESSLRPTEVLLQLR